MCENCPPTGDDGEPLDPETTNMMRVESTSAALQALALVAKGWSSGAEGLFQDQGNRWSFHAVMRMAWVMATACTVLPKPEDFKGVWSSTDQIADQVTTTEGEPVPQDVMARLTMVSDQTQSAFNELIGIASTQDEHTFNQRFDSITDQPHLINPLITALITTAGVQFQEATTSGDLAALDQFQAAVSAGLDLNDGKDGQVHHLKALYDLPSSER